MSRIHTLKCWPKPFEALCANHKMFEFRKNDRDYAVGDILHLEKYDPIPGVYVGDHIFRRVIYIMRQGFGIPDGYCVMSLRNLADTRSEAEEDDGTDYAHPAYHRGESAGVRGACMRILEAMEDPTIPGTAYFPLQEVREKVAAMARELKAAKEELAKHGGSDGKK